MIYHQLKESSDAGQKKFAVLIDPDKYDENKLMDLVDIANRSEVNYFFVGGSLMTSSRFEQAIKMLKATSDIPVIIFPGSVNQVSKYADAILYISLISGRNAEHLIGKHVQAAPFVKKYNLEAISTGYMLIESGRTTTAEYISESKPIPRNKPEIATATALAGEYLGMKLIYLEGGSGAENSVPTEMIEEVSKNVSVPVIVGGGIKSPQEAREKINAGAKIIITVNFL